MDDPIAGEALLRAPASTRRVEHVQEVDPPL